MSFMIIFLSYWAVSRDTVKEVAMEEVEEDINQKLQFVRGVQSDDHILGNPNAPIVFYVYSDFNCGFCKDYHKTLRTLARIYATDGTFALVFRHIPFVQIHPDSPMYALASECVAEEVGDSGFWKFSDALYEKVDLLEPLSANTIVEIAEEVGASKQTFVACMRSNRLMEEVTKDFNEAIEAGAIGSPFTIIQTPTKRDIFQGAQEYRTLAQALEIYSRSLEETELRTPSDVTTESEFIHDFEALETVSTTPAITSSSTPPNTDISSKETILDGIIEN